MNEKITYEKPLINPLSKKQFWQETIRVWDYLVESGYNPSYFSLGEITMNYQGFKKLIKDEGKNASIKETRYYRISAVWIGPVGICFTEIKRDKDDWLLEHNWEPLK